MTYSYFCDIMSIFADAHRFYAQDYKSRKPMTVNGFVREQYNCPSRYRRKCDCFVSIAVRTFEDKVQLFVSGEHTKDSHAEGRGTLTVK